MANITRDAAYTLLGPYLPILRAAIEGGWDDYLTHYSADDRAIHDATTRANLVNDHTGMPDVPRLDAGYVLDTLETMIVGIFVAQPDRLGSVSWKIDVLDATGGTADGSATPFEFMSPTVSPSRPHAGRSPVRIRPGVNPRPGEVGSQDDSEPE